MFANISSCKLMYTLFLSPGCKVAPDSLRKVLEFLTQKVAILGLFFRFL